MHITTITIHTILLPQYPLQKETPLPPNLSNPIDQEPPVCPPHQPRTAPASPPRRSRIHRHRRYSRHQQRAAQAAQATRPQAYASRCTSILALFICFLLFLSLFLLSWTLGLNQPLTRRKIPKGLTYLETPDYTTTSLVASHPTRPRTLYRGPNSLFRALAPTYRLNKAEYLQLYNLRPSSQVMLELVIEEVRHAPLSSFVLPSSFPTSFYSHLLSSSRVFFPSSCRHRTCWSRIAQWLGESR